MNIEISDSELMGYISGQFLSHEGLKKFGERGENAALGKMSQLHERDAFVPRWAKDSFDEDKKRVLDLALPMEEKGDQHIKGCGAANGSEQCGFVAKEDAASPTALLESVILTGLIDTEEV